jgi:hypothetical protein
VKIKKSCQIRNRVAMCVIAALMTGCSAESPAPPPMERNPYPKERYEIIFKPLEDPGAPITKVYGIATYQIANRKECLPIDYNRSLGGSRHTYHHKIDFDLALREDGSYAGKVYLDQMVDGNFYGLETCHWQLANVGVWFRFESSINTASLNFKEVINERNEEMICRRPHLNKNVAHQSCSPEYLSRNYSADKIKEWNFRINMKSIKG